MTEPNSRMLTVQMTEKQAAICAVGAATLFFQGQITALECRNVIKRVMDADMAAELMKITSDARAVEKAAAKVKGRKDG